MKYSAYILPNTTSIVDLYSWEQNELYTSLVSYTQMTNKCNFLLHFDKWMELLALYTDF